jgi:hypothetical protein
MQRSIRHWCRPLLLKKSHLQRCVCIRQINSEFGRENNSQPQHLPANPWKMGTKTAHGALKLDLAVPCALASSSS